MTAIPGVRLTGTAVPTDTADTYPVTDPAYGIDGYRSVADKPTRNAIPTARRRQGMLVCTQDTMETWQLKAPPWTGLDGDWTAASGSASTIVPLVDATPTVAAEVTTHTIGRTLWDICIYNAATGARENWTVDANNNAFSGSDATGTPYYTIYGSGPGGNGHTIQMDYNGVGALQKMRLLITANGTGWAVEVLRMTQVAGAA